MFDIFCMNTQTDATKWDAWNLADWEFYMMTVQELRARNVGNSISLAALRNLSGKVSNLTTYVASGCGR